MGPQKKCRYGRNSYELTRELDSVLARHQNVNLIYTVISFLFLLTFLSHPRSTFHLPLTLYSMQIVIVPGHSSRQL